jgi:hypothetical protein
MKGPAAASMQIATRRACVSDPARGEHEATRRVDDEIDRQFKEARPDRCHPGHQ